MANSRNSLLELHNVAKSDLSSMGRVSHRLAMTEAGAPLQKVLHILLPRLLHRIGSNHQKTKALDSYINLTAEEKEIVASTKSLYDQIHSKLVEMLSHIIKRVRADSSCKLPCDSVMGLLYDSDKIQARLPTEINPFTLNLSLTFLTIGLPRCSSYELESILPGLLALVGAHSSGLYSSSKSRKNQAYQVGHLLLRTIEIMTTESKKGKNPERLYNGKKPAIDQNLDETKLNETNIDHMKISRSLCSTNKNISAAVYDLLLDLLLHRHMPPSSDIPPPGVSYSGKLRILSGTSTVAKTWTAEYASSGKLRDLKLAVLNFISPSRRWDIFDCNGVAKKISSDIEKDQIRKTAIARTVSLLVVSSGDSHIDVSGSASLFLKTHLDSMRSSNKKSKDEDASHHNDNILGDHLSLVHHLLTLVVGDIMANKVISKLNPNASNMKSSLGVEICQTSAIDRTEIMSMKRSAVSEKSASTILSFIATKIFDEIPAFFPLHSRNKSLKSFFSECGSLASAIGGLILLVGHKYFDKGRALSGMPVTNDTGNPSVATARLLNSFCIRLSSLYDEISTVHYEGHGFKEFEIVQKVCDQIQHILLQLLQMACSIVSTASSHNKSEVKDKIGIETRDSGYGIICTIFRSKLTLACNGCVFKFGIESSTNCTSNISKSIAATLFGCCANENDGLQPRAVAALDSVLAAYCRLNQKLTKNKAQTLNTLSPSMEINPWASDSKELGVHSQIGEELAYDISFDGFSASLLPLLWDAANNLKPKVSRHAAAKWSNELLKSLDLVKGCHILCYLSGDKDTTISSIAKEGLGIASYIGEDIDMDYTVAGKDATMPDFNDFISTILVEESCIANPVLKQKSFFDFSPRGQGYSLRFGMMCLLSDIYSDEDKLFQYLTVLSDSLLSFYSSNGNVANRQDKESMDMLDESAICLAECLRTSQFARQQFVDSSLSLQHEQLKNLVISVSSSKARRHLASAIGYILEDTSIWKCQCPDDSTGIELWIKNTSIASTIELCASKLNMMHSNLFSIGEAHGAAFLGSQCVRAYRLLLHRENHNILTPLSKKCWEFASSILSSLGRGLQLEEVIGNACSQSLSIALSYDGPDSPNLDKNLANGVIEALFHLSTSLQKYGNGDDTDATRTSSLAETAGVVLAASTVQIKENNTKSDDVKTYKNSLDIDNARLQCINALFALPGSLSSRKDPEINLIVGESLAHYADAFCPKGTVWTLPSSKQEPTQYESEYANQLPPHSHVVYRILKKEIKTTNPLKRTSFAPVMLALVGRAARMTNNDSDMVHRSFVQEIFHHLEEFQTALLHLLVDPKSKHLSRESCCLCLAACQGLNLACTSGDRNSAETNKNHGQSNLNDRLLKAFGQTTNHGQSAMMETRQQHAQRMRENRGEAQGSGTILMEDFGGELEVGGAAGMGEATLGAYREMASAAVLLERPDILYSLMILSVNSPTWSAPGFRDRYSTSSLLGEGSNSYEGNTDKLRVALRPHLAKLIPRMLRATHDPNRQTREQMSALWIGLTGGGAESRSVISEHFTKTLDSLINDAMSKLWRVRVGACRALSEIIIGRDWNELGGGNTICTVDDASLNVSNSAASRLLRLFKVTVRSLDDIRLTVRESGESLARSVRSLSVNLCTPKSHVSTSVIGLEEAIYENQSDETAVIAASTILPWLVKHGLNQPCAEAAGFTISCLLGVVEVSKPATLQNVLPDLIYALLMAMSGLEPQAFNYLQVRAAGQDTNGTNTTSASERLERMRLQIAQSGEIASALTKCLDMVKHIGLSSQKAVVPQIDSALRCGAGFATRAAAADAVSSLCNICPLAFAFPGSSTTNPTVRLLRALYFASEREQGNAARDKMTHAFGNLAALAPGSSVRSLAIRLCDRYKSATGSNDDPAARKAAASAMRSIAVRASNQFADGGVNDIWNKRVLPLAYIYSHDQTEKSKDITGSLWKEVWDEGGQVSNTSQKSEDSFSVQLQEKLLPYITNSIIDALNDVSWYRRVTACRALSELADIGILAPSPQSVRNRLGTEEIIKRTRRRAGACQKILQTCIGLLIRSRLWTGKADLVKTIVKIAGYWINIGFMNDEYGHSDIPIVHQVDSWNDLFVDDNWFVQRKTNAEDDVMDDTLKLKQSNDIKNESINKRHGEKIDFTEEDSIFHDNEQVMDDIDSIKMDSISMVGKPTNSKVMPSRSNKSQTPVTFTGLCRVLLEQGVRIELPSATKTNMQGSFYEPENLPYRAASLLSLSQLLQGLEIEKGIISSSRLSGTESAQDIPPNAYTMVKKFLYREIVPHLILIVDNSDSKIFLIEDENVEDLVDMVHKRNENIPPLIVTRCINCISATMFNGMTRNISPPDNGFIYHDVLLLSKLFLYHCGPKQSAWTVREAAGSAAATIASKAHILSLRKVEIIENLISCTVVSLKDRKFWRVRYSGLKILLCLCSRVRSSATFQSVNGNENQLMLEALLPSKEKIQKIATSNLSDTESKVTSIASEICNATSWWP